MKTLKLILLPLITVSIIAQELDEEFLASLPDDIRKDIQETNQRKADGTAETYRPYVYSSKLKQAETFLKLKDRLESDLLELERRLDFDDSTDASQELVLYGSDFFNTFQTSFMPINEPNPDSGYMLDVGDLLEIQLVGSEEYVEDLLINSDGSISMPDIGKVVIAGLSLNDASQLIKSKVKSTFIGTEAFVSLAEIRDVNILDSLKSFSEPVQIKVRSTGKLLKAKVNIGKNNALVEILEDETGISPGQACVFYLKDKFGDKVLGGGWIQKAENKILST